MINTLKIYSCAELIETNQALSEFILIGLTCVEDNHMFQQWKGETPAGIKGVLRPTTQFTLVIVRTQLFGPGSQLRFAPGGFPPPAAPRGGDGSAANTGNAIKTRPTRARRGMAAS